MADIFENESEVLQDSSYRAHLNRNWQKGNDEFRAINERISKVNQNESNNSELMASHIDLHGRDYKSLPFRLDNMQIIGESANQLANSINNKINTLVEDKLAQIDNNVHAYPNADAIKQAYPNGKLGVFVAVDTGHQWYWVDGAWKDGGFYQASAPIDDIRAVDAKANLNKNRLNDLLTDFIAEVTERKKIDADLIDKVASYLTALELKEVRLKDNANNFLWNGNGYVTGNVYLPKTDKTGLEEGVPVDSSIIGYTFLSHLEEYGLPILKLESPDLLNLTSKAQGKLKGVKFDYNPNGNEGVHLSGTLKSIKVQGASSAFYPKKNYTLNFENDVKFKSMWGNHDKYVIKADWIDFSHIRNEFCAWLWGQVRKTRFAYDNALVDNNGNFLVRTSATPLGGEIRPQFAMGMNLGAIDSYPVLVIVNGIYHGLYSMTVPKDDWMANMGYGTKEAIVSAENHAASTQFKEHVHTDGSGNLFGDDFSMEYVTDEKNQTWLVDSLNGLIDAVKNKTSLDKHLDIESAIDYLLFNVTIGNGDGVDKNFLLDTWDGTKWTFAAYDMDSTFGNYWDGKSYTSSSFKDLVHHKETSTLYNLLLTDYKESVQNRWNELRANVFSADNLITGIYNHAVRIPAETLSYEKKRWPGIPGTQTNKVSQICNWVEKRLKIIDTQIDNI